jgi:hypothetical protein
MNQDINRLLMELERNMRSINRELINPKIKELTVDDMRPVLCLVAHARARYLKALFDLGAGVQDGMPTDAQFDELRKLRIEYDELLNGAKALETAIQRGYIDVSDNANQ